MKLIFIPKDFINRKVCKEKEAEESLYICVGYIPIAVVGCGAEVHQAAFYSSLKTEAVLICGTKKEVNLMELVKQQQKKQQLINENLIHSISATDYFKPVKPNKRHKKWLSPYKYHK